MLAVQTAETAVAQVIVVRADDHDFIRERSITVDRGDDVLARGTLALDIHFEVGGPACERRALRLERAIDVLFDLGQALTETRLQQGVHDRPAHLDDRDTRARIAGRVAEIHELVAAVGQAAVVDEQHPGSVVQFRVRDLGVQGSMAAIVLTIKDSMVIARARRAPQDHHQLARHIDVLEIIVILRTRCISQKNKGRGELSGGGTAGDLEVRPLAQRDGLTLRPAQDQGIGAARFRAAADAKRLEVAAIATGRFEPGLLEFIGDIVGGEFDALGRDAPALTFVGGQERDIPAHPGLDRLIGRLAMHSRQEHAENSPRLPTCEPLPRSHYRPLDLNESCDRNSLIG